MFSTNLKLSYWLFIPILIVIITSRYLLVAKAVENFEYKNERVDIELKYKDCLIDIKKTTRSEIGNKGIVTFWFDDGWLNQYEKGAVILDKYGYQGVISAITSYADFGGYISWEKLRQLQNNGWEITSHSETHNCEMYREHPEIIQNEIEISKEKMLLEGLRSNLFVPPCGVESAEMTNAVKENYLGMRLVGSTTNQLPIKDNYKIYGVTITSETSIKEIQNWLLKAKKEKSWIIFLFHQIEKNSDKYSVSPEFLEEIAKTIKINKMPVVLPSQVLKIDK